MTELHPVPECDGYLINREGTRIVGPGRWQSKDLTLCPNETNGRLRVKVQGRYRYVHELVALTFIGPRPDGMEVLHGDDDWLNNHADNLSYGTRLQNVQDAIRNGVHVSVWHKNKTQCPQGHDYDEENTYWYTKKNGVIGRSCKTCSRDSTRAWRERNNS